MTCPRSLQRPLPPAADDEVPEFHQQQQSVPATEIVHREADSVHREADESAPSTLELVALLKQADRQAEAVGLTDSTIAEFMAEVVSLQPFEVAFLVEKLRAGQHGKATAFMARKLRK